jgi:hypothetical protein
MFSQNLEKAGGTGFQPVLDSRERLSYICRNFRNSRLRDFSTPLNNEKLVGRASRPSLVGGERR